MQLPDDAPMRREWAVVCDAPDHPAMLAAWELPGQSEGPGRQAAVRVRVDRRPGAVRDAARLRAGGAAVRPPRGGPLLYELAETRRPPPGKLLQAVRSSTGSSRTSTALSARPLRAGFTKSDDSGSEGGERRQRPASSRSPPGGATRRQPPSSEGARSFESANTGAKIDLKIVPYEDMFTGIDAGLQSGTAPDVFRVDYPTMGVYASTDQLLDLTPSLDELADVGPIPALLQAVTHADRVYGMPQHVDTSAMVYRPDVLARRRRHLGARTGPRTPGRGRSSREVAASSRSRSLARSRAVLRQLAGSSGRSAGSTSSSRPAVAAARRGPHDAGDRQPRGPTGAGLHDQRSSTRGWVPENTSTKAATYPDALFTSGRLAMVYAGNFLLPGFAETIKRPLRVRR